MREINFTVKVTETNGEYRAQISTDEGGQGCTLNVGPCTSEIEIVAMAQARLNSEVGNTFARLVDQARHLPEFKISQGSVGTDFDLMQALS